MGSLSRLKEWFQKNQKEAREDYFRFLRFPSVSADPAFRREVLACAEWLVAYMVKKGIRAEQIQTEGYPIVYAEDLRAGPQAPTVLIYGHYDVQPADPVELWKSPPFEPVQREGKIYARGAADDKGQIFYAVLALCALKELGTPLPVNLKFCIEGEEESLSAGLAKALPHLKEKMGADLLLVVDFDQLQDGSPAMTFGGRGLVSLEVTFRGSKGDLHSGLHGGLAYNPNRALAESLAALWDEKGRIQVSDFYADVEDVPQEEIARYHFPFDQAHYSKEFGIEAFGGEKERSLQEKNWLRPTVEINGMSGGYTGAGVKTVIPAQATAKLSCRLVPHQDPEKIARSLASFFQQRAPQGMKVEVQKHSGAFAFRGHPRSKLAKAIATAAKEVTGKKCRNILSGASIPIVAALMRAIGAEMVGMGYGLPSDDIHAPNEHFDWERLEKGFLTLARAIELL